jgi:uridine phosphorylase
LPGHLRPTAAISADALLPADPGLGLELAQRLLDRPLMANHNHGLWGYSGNSASDRELTIQATGIGGPSAAVVLTELADHGVRRAIRIGRCTGLDPALRAGDVVVVSGALADDGASRALGFEAVAADPVLTEAVLSATGEAIAVTVASFDLYRDPLASERRRGWRSAGARVADLETAAVLAVGDRLGLAAAAALVVAETAGGEGAEELIENRLLSLGADCARAFGRSPGAIGAQPSAPGTASLP